MLLVVAQACSSTPATGSSLTVTGPDAGVVYEADLGVAQVVGGDVFSTASTTGVPLGTSTVVTFHDGGVVGTASVYVRPGVVTSPVVAPTP